MQTKKSTRLERAAGAKLKKTKKYFNSRFWFCLVLIASCGVGMHDIVFTPFELACSWLVLLVVGCIWVFVWGRENNEW